jgi:hypothetical protein
MVASGEKKPQNAAASAYLLWKFSVDTTHVFLEHLSVPDLLLHISGLSGIATKHEKTGSQPVQSVNGSKVLQIVFLGQNENDCIVAVTTTWMNL